MQSLRVNFPNPKGESLSGRLDMPVDREPVAYALFAHGFSGHKNLKTIINIDRALTQQGIAVLRFDFTGLGDSEGDFAKTDFSSTVGDLTAAARFLEDEYQAPRIVIGHSLGGAAALRAAESLPTVRALATIAAPIDASPIENLLEQAAAAVDAGGALRFNIAGKTLSINPRFAEELERSAMERAIHRLRRALLIFHSPLDEVVGIGNATAIFKAALHPKSFVSLDKADHMLSDEGDSSYVGAVVAAWARKYLDVPREQLPLRAATENRIVAHTGAQGYRTEILANGHALVADEPLAAGGTNTGPGPYELLGAALGACTSMTLRMYADRKKWPVEGITTRIAHHKIHAEDCENCETKEGKLDRFEREIELAGPLDDAQRQRLVEIADKCPVHRTLHSEIIVDTKLKP